MMTTPRGIDPKDIRVGDTVRCESVWNGVRRIFELTVAQIDAAGDFMTAERAYCTRDRGCTWTLLDRPGPRAWSRWADVRAATVYAKTDGTTHVDYVRVEGAGLLNLVTPSDADIIARLVPVDEP